MKRNLLIALFLLPCAFTHADEMCKSRYESFVSRVQFASKTPLNDLTTLLVAEKPKVVFIGEDHYNRSSQKNYTNIAKYIQGYTGADCLFVEQPTMEEARSRPHWDFDFDALERLNLKLIAVDAQRTEDPWNQVEARNYFMANKINAALSDGTCSAGIMFVGKAHITPKSLAYSPKPYVLLNELIIHKTSSINFISANYHKPIDPYYEDYNYQDLLWSDCGLSENIDLKKLPQITTLLTKDIAVPIYSKKSVRWDGYRYDTTWSAFDLIIIGVDYP